MNRSPFVCVLVLNWNRRQDTIECVEAVLKSDYPNFDVVVIDNGSVDGSVPALRWKFGRSVDIIENRQNLGYASGFNVGLKYGFEDKGVDYCLVMNNDTLIDQRAVYELVKIAKADRKIGFVTGKVYYYDNRNILQTVGKAYDAVLWNGDHIGNGEEDKGQYDHIRELHFTDDIYTLVSKSLYETIGGYNPLFFLQGEEYDWQARAKENGFRIMYTPHARLWHKVSITIGKTSAIKAYYDCRNPMLVILLHKSPGFFRRYFWLHLRRHVFRGSLISLKQCNFVNALAKWQGLLSGLEWGLRNKKWSLEHFI